MALSGRGDTPGDLRHGDGCEVLGAVAGEGICGVAPTGAQDDRGVNTIDRMGGALRACSVQQEFCGGVGELVGVWVNLGNHSVHDGTMWAAVGPLVWAGRRWG